MIFHSAWGCFRFRKIGAHLVHANSKCSYSKSCVPHRSHRTFLISFLTKSESLPCVHVSVVHAHAEALGRLVPDPERERCMMICTSVHQSGMCTCAQPSTLCDIAGACHRKTTKTREIRARDGGVQQNTIRVFSALSSLMIGICVLYFMRSSAQWLSIFRRKLIVIGYYV